LEEKDVNLLNMESAKGSVKELSRVPYTEGNRCEIGGNVTYPVQFFWGSKMSNGDGFGRL